MFLSVQVFPSQLSKQWLALKIFCIARISNWFQRLVWKLIQRLGNIDPGQRWASPEERRSKVETRWSLPFSFLICILIINCIIAPPSAVTKQIPLPPFTPPSSLRARLISGEWNFETGRVTKTHEHNPNTNDVAQVVLSAIFVQGEEELHSSATFCTYTNICNYTYLYLCV